MSIIKDYIEYYGLYGKSLIIWKIGDYMENQGSLLYVFVFLENWGLVEPAAEEEPMIYEECTMPTQTLNDYTMTYIMIYYTIIQ